MKIPSTKTIRAFFIILLFPVIAVAQKQDYKEMFLEAESYFLYEEFIEALPLYIQLKEKFPDNFNLDYKIGRCYLSMPYDKNKAITYLEKAVKHMAAVKKESSFKEYNAPLDAQFYLGDAYRINNLLTKAIETYESFKAKVSKETYDIQLISDQIAACKRALESEKKPLDIDEENIGNVVNTRYAESNPVVSADENMIVYAARLPFYQAMFYSKKVDGKWSSPVNMIPELGVDGDCFPTSISSDGTELYVYRTNEYLGDIFVTNYKNGKWTKLRKLNSNINTKYWESHACISADGKILYFTSNREGGYGGLDIYKSQRTSGDNWGTPVNLGSVINSIYNDDTPFINSDGSRLFFSSFGHETIGGYDLFYADRKTDGTWTKPKNFGYPVNTPDDELFLCPLREGSIAYTSVYDPKGYGKYDIQRVIIYNAQNPRKYYVKSKIQLPDRMDLNDMPIHYALYDKNKKDTVFAKTLHSNEISFETVPGNYEVIIKGSNFESQIIPLNIAYGSKEIQKELPIKLKEKSLLADNKEIEKIDSNGKLGKNDSKLLSNENATENVNKNKAIDETNAGFSESQLTALENTEKNKLQTDDSSASSNKDQNLTSVAPPQEENAITPKDSQDTNKKWNSILFGGGIALAGILFFIILLFKRKKKNKVVESDSNNLA